MQVHRLPVHALSRFDSSGVELVPVGRALGTALVHVVRVETGGTIGEHPATVHQVLTVVSGRARVSAGDGAVAELGPGDAAEWRAGETHQTWAVTDLVATIVESGDGIEVAGAQA